MYGVVNEFKDDNNILRNEVAIQNLIAVANNSMLFDALDDETKVKLVDFIKMYTKSCLGAIEKYNYEDFEAKEEESRKFMDAYANRRSNR